MWGVWNEGSYLGKKRWDNLDRDNVGNVRYEPSLNQN